MKFKAGDRVKCIRQSDYDQYKVDMNAVHVISVVQNDSEKGSGIVLVGYRLNPDGKPGLHDEKRFRLAQAAVIEQRAPTESDFTPRPMTCVKIPERIPLKPANKRHAEAGAQFFNTWPAHHMGSAVALNELHDEAEWAALVQSFCKRRAC